ncbi:MAG: FAD-dependent oxidoreductase [Spirochaetes bacterium]|nr:FAD-dependent oxidoreductase [Spirochaetota bacterium]
MKYLIIGNGVAGVEAALAIRKNDPTANITIVTSSAYHFYYRPKLIEYLAGETTIEKFTLYKEEFYFKHRIEVIRNITITSLDPINHRISASDGQIFSYDKLLLATGATPFIPPIQGVTLPGIFTLRGISDANNLMQYCDKIKHLIIIGGGLLGLETAIAMKRFAKNIIVIENLEWLLPRQLDKKGSTILQAMLEKKGIQFEISEQVEEIYGNRKVEKIILKSGKILPADAVIISAGIRPRIELAKSAGIVTAKGIIVDDFMKTSNEDIFAAGDSAEHNGIVYGIYPAAREQGRIAGLNMSGEKTAYKKTIISNILKITGIDLYSAGEWNTDNATIYSCCDSNMYIKYLEKENPIGAIVVGDSHAIKVAQKVMEGKSSSHELLQLIKENQRINQSI